MRFDTADLEPCETKSALFLGVERLFHIDGVALMRFRSRLGLSKEAFGKMVGLTGNQVKQYEDGSTRRCNREVAVKLIQLEMKN